MSTTLPEPETEAQLEQLPEQSADGHPKEDLSLLEDRVPVEFQASTSMVAWGIGFGLLFAIFSYLPIWHTDVWGHLAYGRVILETGRIPQTEPLLPLCEGVKFDDTAWLTQVVTALAVKQWGVNAIRCLFALCLTGSLMLLAWRFWKSTSNHLLSLAGTVGFLWAGWLSLTIQRPQSAGLFCFMALFCLLTSSKRSWKSVLLCAVLMAFWVNLHGSFLVGLGLIGLMLFGHGIDVYFRTGRLDAVWKNSQLHYLVYCLEAALVGCLINPYGLGIFSIVQEISSNLNLRDLVEWGPITLSMYHGKAIALLVLLVIGMIRFSPRRLKIAEILPLTIFTLAALSSVRMAVWCMPLLIWFLVRHGNALWKQYHLSDVVYENGERSGLKTVVLGGVVWIFFAFTPFGTVLMHGQPAKAEMAEKLYRKSLSTQTPVKAVEYLNEHPPQGMVFNTYEWGDYLLWAGPKEMQLFLNSHAHLIPREVWQDYLHTVRAGSAWADKLDRYGIDTVIVDYRMHDRLIRRLKREGLQDWTHDYDDGTAAIFRRRRPVTRGAEPPVTSSDSSSANSH